MLIQSAIFCNLLPLLPSFLPERSFRQKRTNSVCELTECPATTKNALKLGNNSSRLLIEYLHFVVGYRCLHDTYALNKSQSWLWHFYQVKRSGNAEIVFLFYQHTILMYIKFKAGTHSAFQTAFVQRTSERFTNLNNECLKTQHVIMNSMVPKSWCSYKSPLQLIQQYTSGGRAEHARQY